MTTKIISSVFFLALSSLTFADSKPNPNSAKPYVIERPCGHFVCNYYGWDNSDPSSPMPLQKWDPKDSSSAQLSPDEVECANLQLQNIIEALKKRPQDEKLFKSKAFIQIDVSKFESLNTDGLTGFEDLFSGETVDYHLKNGSLSTISMTPDHIYVRPVFDENMGDFRLTGRPKNWVKGCIPVSSDRILKNLKDFDGSTKKEEKQQETDAELKQNAEMSHALDQLNSTANQLSRPPFNETRSTASGLKEGQPATSRQVPSQSGVVSSGGSPK